MMVHSISTIALIFIMFYGGFGTRWKSARPVALEAGLLATAGVVLTALLTGLFCHFVMRWEILESFLMGAVISSTDAASVFSILRTRKLGLKNNTAPLVEMESGSNDPMSYMLTAIVLSLMAGGISGWDVLWKIFAQMVFGAAGGLAIASASVFLLHRFNFRDNGFDILLFISIAIASYALPDAIGGNGYLSAYIVGIVLGNTDFSGRKQLISFFNALTGLMQIIIFFLLGMLAIPSHLYDCLLPAVIIFAFISAVARPLSVYGVLAPFGKYPRKQLDMISFVGLRGAASIVFAITILISGINLQNDIFSIVFIIVLISIAIQGSLIPVFARHTGMTDSNADVMTTFSDFCENSEMSFGAIRIRESNKWCKRYIKDLDIPQGCIIALIVRGEERIIPKGNTLLEAGDEVVTCTRSYQDSSTDSLLQHPLSENSRWAGHKVSEYPNSKGNLLVMIQRDGERIIPNGDTILQNGDVLVILKRN